VEKFFKRKPAELKVARTIVELGLTISEDGKIYCGPIEIPLSKISEAIGVDRRVVDRTVRSILGQKELKEVFMKLRPAGPLLRDVAKIFGFGVVVVTPTDAKAVGIIADVSSLIAKEGISIRQILADDPELFPEPKLVIITEREIPGHLVSAFLKVPRVKGVSVY